MERDESRQLLRSGRWQRIWWRMPARLYQEIHARWGLYHVSIARLCTYLTLSKTYLWQWCSMQTAMSRRYSCVSFGFRNLVTLSYLNASDTQYEMKLVTPHFRRWRGTGSRSRFVLYNVSSILKDIFVSPPSPHRLVPTIAHSPPQRLILAVGPWAQNWAFRW
jgi:hypothetical protein